MIAFGALGGTISMVSGDESGIRPSLGAEDLVTSVSAAAGVRIRTATLQRVGSSSLTARQLVETLAWAEQEVDAGAAGVVISQGTDTLEETAYLWDLLWQRSEPLIVTAAMRGPEQPGADGPANVLAAFTVAASPGARDRGVLTVLDDQIHAARWVRKSHTVRTGAFASPGAAALGLLVEGEVAWTATTPRDPAVPAPDRAALAAADWPWVPLLEFHLGDDGRLARAAVDAGAAALVVAGSGGGHVSIPASDVYAELARRVPVVLAGRTAAGPVLQRTYGYQGAEIDLIARGLLPAGWLAPLKARTLTQLLLAAGADRDQLAAELARRGRLPR
ncbi:L-asparaginase [Enemella evansiae]|uniref:L-asparaginase n=1 Tax=Enemella evansiae TaxID=2016499 RepID=A0A255G1F3_9ACTN|nr:L-asparaginase [Enemella evansiae]OYO20672.1 L-asparaginase [Enemella evansiae]